MEVWHHCPRSQMVAAAMSQGSTTSDQALKFRDVFLGSGSCPLHSLLNKPQVHMLVHTLQSCHFSTVALLGHKRQMQAVSFAFDLSETCTL